MVDSVDYPSLVERAPKEWCREVVFDASKVRVLKMVEAEAVSLLLPQWSASTNPFLPFSVCGVASDRILQCRSWRGRRCLAYGPKYGRPLQIVRSRGSTILQGATGIRGDGFHDVQRSHVLLRQTVSTVTNRHCECLIRMKLHLPIIIIAKTDMEALCFNTTQNHD